MPARSRLTVRRPATAPFARNPPLAEALRSSREALADIQKQLDALLAAVRSPTARPEPDAGERLQLATRRVGATLGRLATTPRR